VVALVELAALFGILFVKEKLQGRDVRFFALANVGHCLHQVMQLDNVILVSIFALFFGLLLFGGADLFGGRLFAWTD
jgi:hypothetical protein